VQSLQTTLFSDDVLFSLAWREEALQHALDEIRERFGNGTILRGRAKGRVRERMGAGGLPRRSPPRNVR